ncbi:uncharacterized protein LOC127131053 [Lathyrus oleraceus]|uniref:uncharacterized protein LOC127131053 n=1 Tax=Pisum sativum TaxID=3888 RepID=UPI0021CFE736|nr:uncharacterized protein LOC127131053 [Pisum sativum]
MNPPGFHGGLNPVEAYGGTPNMERVFPACVGVQRQCSVTENNLRRVQEEFDQYGVGQMNQGGLSHQFRPRPRPFKRRQMQPTKPNHPSKCQVCRKSHSERCARSGIRCFTCQREGHMSRECPQNKVQMQGKSTNQVYMLGAKEAKSNNAFIAGTCLVNNHPCFVLFDCGATHSFVSIQCLKRVGLQAIPLSPSMVVTTSMDDGMDWLSANSVFIGCEEKLIIIPSSGATPKDVLTTILEGTVGMVNFLFENENSVLLVLTKEFRDNLSVTQIPIVCEFLEVFPEDVTSLPPEREVESSIDLIPRTTPISVSPYRRAPLKLRELKNQLEELLTKHFI